MPKTAFIALGSNLGDSLLNMQKAIGAMAAFSEGEIMKSSVWRSAPVGFDDDVPAFLNAVVGFQTSLTGEALLASLKVIESDQGRGQRRTERSESRPIDLDIIDLGGEILNLPGLTLPHPRAADRAFVLRPLAEIAPGFQFPGDERNLAQFISVVADQEIERTELRL